MLKFLLVGETETSEKNSLPLLQEPTKRRSNQHRPLPRLNQVWNAINTDKCCECKCHRDPEEKGLTIVDYESAWLADLVGACVLLQTTPNHTSGKPNGTACAEMMTLQCSTTNFPTMTHSSGEPNSQI